MGKKLCGGQQKGGQRDEKAAFPSDKQRETTRSQSQRVNCVGGAVQQSDSSQGAPV